MLTQFRIDKLLYSRLCVDFWAHRHVIYSCLSCTALKSYMLWPSQTPALISLVHLGLPLFISLCCEYTHTLTEKAKGECGVHLFSILSLRDYTHWDLPVLVVLQCPLTVLYIFVFCIDFGEKLSLMSKSLVMAGLVSMCIQ